MTTRKPTISVITPSYNQGRYLERTIASVLSQDYASLEYIVLDGGSIDESVAIIKMYSRHLTHWESGPDGGQAAAIKRGMELATGDIICWLNSDDLLLPGALAEVASECEQNDWVLFAGQCAYIDENDRPTHVHVPKNRSVENMLTWGHALGQMATFYRRRAIAEVGGLDASFTYAFDFDLFVKLRQCGRFQFTNNCLAAFRLHATAKTSCIPEIGRKENDIISCRYSSIPFLNPLRKVTRRMDLSTRLTNRVAWTLNGPSITDAMSLAMKRSRDLMLAVNRSDLVSGEGAKF